MANKLIPYTVYLPEEHYDRIKEYAQERKASGLIRDAICSFLDGESQYQSGYNKALKDLTKKVKSNGDLKNIAIGSQTISSMVAKIISEMEA